MPLGSGIPLTSSFDVFSGIPLDARSVVADLTERDAIPDTSRYEGLVVFVISEGAAYRLVGGITNAEWVAEGSGGGGGGGGTHTFKINGDYSTAPVPSNNVDGFFIFPSDATITNVFIFQSIAGSGGTTELDLQVRPFGSPTWTTIFSTTPKITNTAGADAWGGVGDTVTGITAPIMTTPTIAVTAKTALRMRLVTKQTGNPNTVGLQVVYE